MKLRRSKAVTFVTILFVSSVLSSSLLSFEYTYAATGYILINKITYPSTPGLQIPASGSLNLYFGGVTWSGGQFYLMMSKDGYSQVSAGDRRYSPVFDVSKIASTTVSVYKDPAYPGVWVIGNKWVNGTINQDIAGGNYFIKAFDGSTSSVAVTDTYIKIIGSVEVVPSSGPAGATLQIQASGLTSNTYVNILYYNLISAKWLLHGSAQANALGQLTYFANAPDLMQALLPGLQPESGDTIIFRVIENSTGAIYESSYLEYRRGLKMVGHSIAPSGYLYGNNTDLTGSVKLRIGEQFNVSGSWFSPIGMCTLLWDGAAVRSTYVSESGSFQTIMEVPLTSFGDHFIGVLDAAGVLFNVKVNVIAPTLSITPNSGVVGTNFAIIGSGFPASWALAVYNVTLTWEGSPNRVLGWVITDSTGSFAFNSSAPNDYAGAHRIYATVNNSAASIFTTFTIVQAVATDIYEPDNSFSQSRNMTVTTSLQSQYRSIAPAGDVDYIRFWASAGNYTFYTVGSTDTVGGLYDANYSLVASDDDGGEGANFMLNYVIYEGGFYFLVVRGYSNSTVGDYTLYYTYNPSTDVVEPSVRVLAPNGGESLTVGSVYRIRWNASDNVGVSYVHIWLFQGTSQIDVIASGHANTGYYDWTVPNRPGSNYKVRVSAVDSAGNAGTDESDAAFIIQLADNTPPVIRNVCHNPLYPIYGEEIFVYADVTDNIAVSSVWVNYTLNGGGAWLLKQMQKTAGDTYSVSLGSFSIFQIIGFYVIAYDAAGNKAVGSEIIPPLPEPPKVSPIVVSDRPPQPLPNGKDISYNTTRNETKITANVTELGIFSPGASYHVSYSLDGGITWIQAEMTQVSEYVWTYVIPAISNILFKIEGNNGKSTQVYWIIVGPWEYPIYLYFSTAEQYYPVKGLDFDGDANIANNKDSYDANKAKFINEFLENDIDHDGVPEAWSYAYMRPDSIDDGCLVIEYWIYYAYNSYPIISNFGDNHEHDFEAVYVWVDIATGNIKKLACTQHLWVNHYIFDVMNPPRAINLAVENGGHGMALLEDSNNDGFPDVNILGSYIISPSYVDSSGGKPQVPLYFRDSLTINPGSVIAQLYPWAIYDPRIDSAELHLFDDPTTLTNGYALDLLFPLLPNVINEIPQYYDGLASLFTENCLLKTSYGFTLDGDAKIAFGVISPLYREEFRNAEKMWRKASFEMWISKLVISGLISRYVGGIWGILAGKASNYLLQVFVDPVECTVVDSEGRTLGYSDKLNDLPGGVVLVSRNMTNGLYDLYLIMTNSLDGYVYDIKGTGAAQNYNFTLSLMDAAGNFIQFNASSIPVSAGEIHRYKVNWTALEEGKNGVEVNVDLNADGLWERDFWSDGNLTAVEFEMAVIPEFQSGVILVSLMLTTLLIMVLFKKKRRTRAAIKRIYLTHESGT